MSRGGYRNSMWGDRLEALSSVAVCKDDERIVLKKGSYSHSRRPLTFLARNGVLCELLYVLLPRPPHRPLPQTRRSTVVGEEALVRSTVKAVNSPPAEKGEFERGRRH